MNCTFINNAANDGGGMYNTYSEGTTLIDSAVCANTPDNIYGDYADGGGNVVGPNPPPPPPLPPVVPAGACCLDAGCLEIGEDDCTSAGGTYMGDDSQCASTDCPEPCPADVNGSGKVDIQDIFDVLAQWGPCQ